MSFKFQSLLTVTTTCSLVGLLYSGVARAEDPDKSKGFYDKNFAETPLKKREGGRFPDGSFPTPKSGSNTPEQYLPDKSTQQQIEKLLKDSKSGEWQREMGADNKSVAPMKSDAPQGDLTGLMRAIPVRSIGGIINSLDAQHYTNSLQQLTDFARAKNLNIGTIYTLGDMRIATENPNVPKVVARGGVVRMVSNIPQGYNVNLSPTWVLKTDEGEILLEAVGPLEKYFNQKGEYLDRETRKTPGGKTS